jgi:hypothetical protein
MIPRSRRASKTSPPEPPVVSDHEPDRDPLLAEDELADLGLTDRELREVARRSSHRGWDGGIAVHESVLEAILEGLR